GAEPGPVARTGCLCTPLGGAEDGSTEGLPLRHEGDWPGRELRRAGPGSGRGAVGSAPGAVSRAESRTVHRPGVPLRPKQPPAPCPRARVSAEDCTRLTMLFLLW